MNLNIEFRFGKGFAVGLLIHSILQISYQILFLSANGDEFYNCASYVSLVLDILFPIYSWFILFFIVKYINVIINEHRSAARLFLLHAIGTSLAFWIFTIVRETTDAIGRANGKQLHIQNFQFKVKQLNKKIVNFLMVDNSTESNTTLNHRSDELLNVNCDKYNALNTIQRQFSPYLYPFIIEYCILIVGIWYMMWANINRCPRKVALTSGNGNESDGGVHDSHINSGSFWIHLKIELNGNESINHFQFSIVDQISHSSSSITSRTVNEHCGNIDHDNDVRTHTIVYADCHSSFRGIFCGLILLIMTIVFIILLFVGVGNE